MSYTMTLAEIREKIEFYTLKGNKMNADIYTDILNERLAKGERDEEEPNPRSEAT